MTCRRQVVTETIIPIIEASNKGFSMSEAWVLKYQDIEMARYALGDNASPGGAFEFTIDNMYTAEWLCTAARDLVVLFSDITGQPLVQDALSCVLQAAS